jgi:hypothetical protein
MRGKGEGGGVVFLWQPLVDREGALEHLSTRPRDPSEQHSATTTAGKPLLLYIDV